MSDVYQAEVIVNPETGWRNYVEEQANVTYEDGGAAMIVAFPTRNRIFVLVQSYDESGANEHPLADLLGKRVRITVERIE